MFPDTGCSALPDYIITSFMQKFDAMYASVSYCLFCESNTIQIQWKNVPNDEND